MTTLSATFLHPSTDSTVGDYITLLKPRVMSLVVFSGVVGLIIAPGTIHPLIGLIAICMIALGSGAAGAINMWYDRDIDAIMARTQARPIPAGKIAPEDALGFAIILACFSVLIMGFAVNYVAAGLLAIAILYYVFIYTVWLKRRTPQNIVIGGAAGAFPPLIGWAAVTGSLSLYPWLCFGIIFFWTCPHFWALSLYCFSDYAKAGIPMLPNSCGVPVTKRHILFYSIVTALFSLLPWMLGYTGMLYGLSALLLGSYLCILSLRLWLEPAIRFAKKLFLYSILYLFALFAMMILDHFIYIA